MEECKFIQSKEKPLTIQLMARQRERHRRMKEEGLFDLSGGTTESTDVFRSSTKESFSITT